MIEKQPDMEVVGEAENGRIAFELAAQTNPHIIIMDVSMPNLNGMEATRQILKTNPDIRIIALSMYSDRHFIIGMLSCGASGYLLKDCAFEEVSNAIHAVSSGKTYLSHAIVDKVILDYFHNLEAMKSSIFNVLTNRERDVLQNLAEGKSVKEIANHLSVSVKTVESHRLQIMRKLNIHSVAELTKYAIREGLTSL